MLFSGFEFHPVDSHSDPGPLHFHLRLHFLSMSKTGLKVNDLLLLVITGFLAKVN